MCAAVAADRLLKDTLMDQYPIESRGSVDAQLKALGITLQPCPPWCTRDHFGPPPAVLYTDEGFFHDGPAIAITDDSASVGDGGKDVELWLRLVRWVPTLTATPAPVHIRLHDGADWECNFTPKTARWLAVELNRLADQADRDSSQDVVGY